MACPIKNDSWKRLLKYLNNNETEAYRIFGAHGEKTPYIPTITELKDDIKFVSLASNKKVAMMKVAVNQYNKDHNTSHRVDAIPQTFNTNKVNLVLNFAPKITMEGLPKNNSKKMNSAGDTKIETLNDYDNMFKNEGNQYIAHGEVFPTYSDAERHLLSVASERDKSKLTPAYKFKGGTMEDALNSIIENSDSEYSKLIAKLFLKHQSNVDISIVSDEEYNSEVKRLKAEGHIESDFNPDTSGGLFSQSANKILVRSSATERMILHEISHALSEQALNEDAIGKEFRDYFSKIKARLIADGVPENTYGLKDHSEFLAEVFSNSRFIKLLQNTQPINTGSKILNAWQEVLDFVRRAFGVTKETAYDEALKKCIDVLNKQDMIYRTSYVPINISTLKGEIDQNQAVIDALDRTTSKLINKAKIYSKSSDDDTARVGSLLRDLTYEMTAKIEANEYSAAILHFVNTISTYELERMQHDAADYINGDTELDSAYINRMDSAINLYSKIIQDLRIELDADPRNKTLIEIKSNVKDALNNFSGRIDSLRTIVLIATRERARQSVKDIMFDEIEETGVNVETAFTEIDHDTNNMNVWFGSLKNSKDVVLRSIYKLVVSQQIKTHFDTLDVGKRLVAAQRKLEASGHKDMSIFFEKSKGKKTGYLIGFYNWGEYIEAEKEMNDALVEAFKKFGYDSYREIPRLQDMTEEEKETYDSIFIPFRDKYMKDSHLRDVGWQANPPVNEDFQKIRDNEDLYEYYLTLQSILGEAKRMLPKMYSSDDASKMLLPQIRKDTLETIKANNKVLRTLGVRFKEKFVRNDQDTEFGGVKMYDENNNVAKLVPIHYTSKIDDTNDLSDDISAGVIAYYQMAHNFYGMSSHIDEIKIIQRTLSGRQFEDGNTGGTFDKSNLSKMLDNFLSANVYGEKEKELYVKLPGQTKKLNVTKVLNAIVKHVRLVNLVLNIPTTISGYAKGSIDFTLDKLAKNYTSFESAAWAELEFDKSIPSILANIGKRDVTGKFNLMMEFNGLHGSVHEKFDRLNERSRILRMKSDDYAYFTYTLADTRLRGKFALSVYNNYRYVDGSFVSLREFNRKYHDKASKSYDESKKWSDYKDKTLYDAYEEKDGKFVVKDEYKNSINQEFETKIKYLLEDRIAVLTGQLTNYDKPELARGVLGKFLLLHRNWLISGLTERFKGDNRNIMTGEKERGYYLSTLSYVGKFIMAKGNEELGAMRVKLAVWNTLEDYEKHNIIKTLGDMAFAAIVIALSNILMGLADDEPDEYWIQLLSLLLNRLRLEHMALMSPKEMMSLLNAPTAAGSLIKTLGGFYGIVTNFDKIEYGAYEDMYRIERAVIKNSIMKNMWELRNTEAVKQKNKFIETQIL